jgi:hypothetical protein
MMRKTLLLSTALTLGALNPALAGGPVVVTEEPVVAEAKPASSAGMLIPILLLAAVAVAVASGNDDDTPPPSPSDIRFKEDIQRIGTNHLGLGVYRFRYKGLSGVWEGVMAQEVAVMHPTAIRHLPQGYMAVDYARLGLDLKQVA